MLWLGLVLATLWLYGLNLPQRWCYRHIPGPRPSWLLGNAVTIRDKLPPFAYGGWKKQYGPMFRAFIGLQPIVVISDPELAREVGVKQFATFHDRTMIMVALASVKRYAATAAGMVQATGAYWASVRAAAQPLFHSSSLASYTPSIVSCADELAGQLEEAARTGQPIDFHQHAGRAALDVTGATVFGVQFNAQSAGKQGSEMPLVAAFKAIYGKGSLNGVFHVLQALTPKVAHYFIGWLAVLWPTTKYRSIEAGRNAIFGISASLVQNAWQSLQHRGMSVTATQHTGWKWFSEKDYAVSDAIPSDDSLISRMLRAKNKESGAGLTDMQVIAQSNSFMIAGYDTTSNLLAFAVYLLGKHPDVQQKLVAEVAALGSKELCHEDLPRLPYTEAVVYEVLRMYPPAVLTPRISTATTKVGGHHLPKGTWVHIDIWGIHHDARYWPQPEAFRPERFLAGAAEAENRHANAFLAFGLGPRMCIGYKLAILEAVVVLARVYRDFTLRLVSSEPLALRFGLVIQPKYGVPVYAERRRGTAAA